MSIVWPPTLPIGPLADGYEDGAPNLQERTSVDQGPARVRAKGGLGAWPMSATFRLTRAQCDTFETFAWDTLEKGTLLFEFTHPRTLETVDIGLVPLSADKLYSLKPLGSGIWWQLTLSLEVFP
jgi:hypothetical protein